MSAITERVLHWACSVTAVVVVLSLPEPLSADLPGPAHGWKFDVVHLHTGRIFRGLVLEETPKTVKFQCIWQNPGEPTKLGIVTTFAADEIYQVKRLREPERAELESRLEKLKPAAEKERMANIELQPAPWRGQADSALSYNADHFVLISNARENIVRRTAVRLEQIYEAYSRFLPPRCPKAEPTQILLVRSMVEYRQMLQKQVGDILNPALFDPANNQIICGTDLQELEEELEALRKRHQQLRDLVAEQQVTLRRVYHNNPPEEFRRQHRGALAELEKADRENAKTFEKATQRLFQTLYHEAFHAYLGRFVYPDGAAVPRWFNEGLAQIFETAILEAGELRLGHADPERLNRVKEALRKNQLVAVRDLLQADPGKFLVSHASNRQLSDDYYLGSWALAYYLTFAQRKLGTPELDDYVRCLGKGAEPLDAFSKLVGEPVPAFEESFHRYLRVLRADGSTAR